MPVLLPIGGYRVAATFDGDDDHQRIEVQRRLDLDRADVRLHVVIPERGKLDLDRGEHTIEVVAFSEEGGGGLSVELLDELDRRLDARTTDAEGRVRFVLPSERLGPPGAGRIKARSRADARRAEAQTEVPIVRFRRTHLTLSASRTRGRPGEHVLLEGRLTDSAGPIESRAVGLFAGDAHLGTVLTDAAGRFRRDLVLDNEHGSHLATVARFYSDAPGRAPSTSNAVEIDVQTGGGAPWPWLLLPIVLCVLLLLLLARRASPRLEAPAPRPEAPVGIEASSRRARRAERWDVGGTIVDHRDGQAVDDAMVTLVSLDGSEAVPVPVDTQGRFSLSTIAGGTWRVRVEAAGYLPTEATIEVPHRGEWSDVRVRLSSLRALALAPFRRVALAVMPSARLWSVWTNREVLARARARGSGLIRGLERLNERVERACYDVDPPSHGDLESIEEGAAAVVQDLSETANRDRSAGG